jgi:hypothetical protein
MRLSTESGQAYDGVLTLRYAAPKFLISQYGSVKPDSP